MDTSSEYLGLRLKSPIIVGSCGLTSSVEDLIRIEQCGAGAVVLKSVFEEEIIHDIKRNTHVTAPIEHYGESYEYIASHVADDSLARRFATIKEATQRMTIPVIGSINCFSHENWLTYAKKFEDCGCKAIELNMAILPYECSLSSEDVERTYTNIIQSIRLAVSIPISVKVGPYFTDMAKFMQRLSWLGIQGITMFNKSVQIDIDTDEMTMRSASCLSSHDIFYDTLRWVAILTNKLRCPISAVGGVYTSEDVVKLLLAGAGTVQVVSCLYPNGIEYLNTLNAGLKDWMAKKGYETVDQFRGIMSVPTHDKASVALRTQFMRYFAEI
ncbi:MAG: dihydroorotate dehydrogenase-like protein [Bacteroidales bacterium]|nr:dihydroorotate dehydrogenase-like protein [Bacteroidales bacterium]